MDTKSLADLTVTTLVSTLPYLACSGGRASKSLGNLMPEVTIARGEKIWQWLLRRATAQPGLRGALEKLCRQPEDWGLQHTVCTHLHTLLTRFPAAATSLEQLFERIGLTQIGVPQAG